MPRSCAPDEGAAIAAVLAAGSAGAHTVAVRFRRALLDDGKAPATVNLRLSALRSAVRLARLGGLVDWELAVPLVRSTGPERDTRGPAVADVRRLLEAAGRQDTAEKAARDTALVRLLFDLGLRRGEVVALNVSDVAGLAVGARVGTAGGRGDGHPPSLAVRRKGGARVRLELPAETAAALGRWLAVRGVAPGPLFVPEGLVIANWNDLVTVALLAARQGHAGQEKQES